MGALYYSDVATLFLRGRLAIVRELVTIQACLRLPQISRSVSAPVGCRWPWQTGHPCQVRPIACIEAEYSTGFHAPHEAMRILGAQNPCAAKLCSRQGRTMNNEVGVIAGIGLDQKTRKSHWTARLDLAQMAREDTGRSYRWTPYLTA